VSFSGGAGLSKSLVLKGMQCPRALWLAKNPPDFEFPADPARQARYAAGTEVGLLAQQLFPGGSEVPYAGLTVSEQVVRTCELLEAGAEVIYEASFDYDGIFVKTDILVRRGGAWEVHEVKSSTEVKDVHLDDLAIQDYVVQRTGLPVARLFLVHIDNSYLRRGAIDVQQLFASEDVTAEARARQADLPGTVARLRTTLTGSAEPDVSIGLQCHDPYDCDFIPWCWRHIPDDSVFDLSGSKRDKFALYGDGYVHLADVPLERLKEKQRFEALASLNRQNHVDLAALRAFLKGLWYPLCHLDFETVSTPIPLYDNTRPYQQLPFQYSLHRQAEPGAPAEQRAYLAGPGYDPRRELAEQLLSDIPADACILTYNQSFEIGVLRGLAELFPDLAEMLRKRVANVRDLMAPFRSRAVYRWQTKGSCSIKQVLPAMAPELSYRGMAIADGEAAMQAYHEMCKTTDPQRAGEIRQQLLEYCRMDTWAMVRILDELRAIAERDAA
jgi:hypothetical protein